MKKIVKRYPDDFKIKVVRHYLETDDSFTQTAQLFSVHNASIIRSWVDSHKRDNPHETFRVCNSIIKYSDEFKRKVVQYYVESDECMNAVAKKFEITFRTLDKWVSKLQGQLVLLKEGSKYVKQHSEEFKREVIRHHMESNDGLVQTANKFHILSPKSVSNWMPIFNADPTTSMMSKPIKKDPAAVPDDPESMALRIQELENALQNEQLKNIALNTMINVAERDLKISIRKKPGAKQ